MTEKSTTQIRAEWQHMRQLYPFYAALSERFGLGVAPYAELGEAEEDALPKVQLMDGARQWMAGIDAKVTAFNIRQLMHSSAPLPEDKLRVLILRHLNHLKKTEQLREKLDFLLVQYFAQVSGTNVHPENVSFQDVAEALAPIIGSIKSQTFAWAYELERLTAKLHDCSTLKHLLEGSFLEQGRTLKRSIGPEYFQPSALVTVTKFNFALRAGFFRLMHADIQAIAEALRELGAVGLKTLDLSRAELGANESLEAVQSVCQEWRKRLRSDYQVGNSFRQLVAIREICEGKLQELTTEQNGSVRPHAPDARQQQEKAGERVIFDAPSIPKVVEIRKRPEEPKQVPKSAPGVKPATPSPIVTNPAAKPVAAKVVGANGAAASPAPAKEAVNKTPPPPAISLDQCLRQIAEQVSAKKGSAASSVLLGETRLPLTTWEVAAFGRGGDKISQVLQRAVAARSLLIIAIEKFKAGSGFDLRGVLVTAGSEATRLEQQMLQARQEKNIEAAVNLAASGKQLANLIAKGRQLIQ